MPAPAPAPPHPPPGGDGLDPVIHQATRLRIMAVLQRNREVAAVALRDALGVTDGNLDAHGKALQRAGYVEARRVLRRGGFALQYRLTPAGAAAFERYAAALQSLLGAASGGPAPQSVSTAQVGRGPLGSP